MSSPVPRKDIASPFKVPAGRRQQQKKYQSPGIQPLRLLWNACKVNPDRVWEKVDLGCIPLS